MVYKSKTQKTYLLTPVALFISGVLSPFAFADDTPLEVIEVHGHAQNKHLALGSSESLLSDLGVDFSAAGGVSNLPILNGLMGDRVKVLVDGADVTVACANHMNPPLSYISANQITSYNVVAGVSPVSAGGDNIAGVISVNSISPQYSDSNELGWHSGYVSAKYSSVDNGRKLGVGARLASDTFSLNYQGSFSDADSYEDGNGDVVLDTLYRAQNHSLTAAMRDDKQQLVIKLTHQKIPYQGFANQYMDMTDNTSYGAIAQYKRSFENSELEGQVNWHSVKHEMGFFSEEKTGMMRMKTDAQDISTQLKWRIALDKNSSILLGQEYYNYSIDDWWPGIEGSTMMGPDNYVNVNNGKRERIAAFAEFESQINTKLWLNAGVRIESINTHVGEVQSYNDDMSMMDMDDMSDMTDMSSMESMTMSDTSTDNTIAAQNFNAGDRDKTDTIVDANLLINYQITNYDELQFGLARKNRAPNLYERYSWGVSTMATTMIGWYGDGNGYIGKPDLDVETAHTISATYIKLAKDDRWRLSTNVWYTDVSDYIDADIVRSFNSYDLDNTARNIFQFTNVDAILYGAKIDLTANIYESKDLGNWQLHANVANTRGKRDDTNQPLYQIKPLQTQLGISQQIGRFENALSWQWVDTKSRVDNDRFENQTDSYSLVNLSSKATWDSLTLSAEVSNVFDEYYQLPLGGVSIAALKQDSSNGFEQLAGQGRSFNVSVSYAF
ncbi:MULTISPECIES: TonB-dependent receptor [unclassified Pseudoalteromonas]|uniref:TonB-dependent receptor n=1 Tax=unclassified Pseudoalteromonas TaxID=194690 RepID=UPI0018CF9592|nr:MULTISPECIES: TonB-dependent receptor [unclassified Pseudoalteromonas]MBH0042723.1 TonB-dependent receptor [Pseudoalteromonas sp. SWXJZ10B]MBH0049898.1 TonB-dependent receptor [Pseudoalteromonas sp. SWYJZ19]